MRDWLFFIKNERLKKTISTTGQILLLILLIWGLQKWQTRHLLSNKDKAPDFTLTSLDGQNYQLSQFQGKKRVVYFFAPWCSVCKMSFPTLNTLRHSKSEDELIILAVALSYDDPEEVRKFIRERPADFPVLFGTPATGEDYKIEGFPTMYIIDEKGNVKRKALGMVTKVNLALDSLF